MLVKIGTTDLSQYIQEGTYDVDSVPQYEEWRDANYVKHRAYIRSTVAGSFNVICSEKTITVSALNKLISDNTKNNKLFLVLWVENKGREYAMLNGCYASTKAVHKSDHDIVTITLEEC